MPLYEYQCTACARLTEKRQKFSDPEITECPHCGGKLERTITAPAVQFKGGGWYADGYGNKNPAASNATSESSPAAEAGGSTGGEKASTRSDSATSPVAPATPAPAAPSATAPAASSTPAK